MVASRQAFQIGVPRLEVEHRQICRRADRIAAAAASGNDAEIRAGFTFLAHYLADHFEAEERWMEEEGYPGLLEHARVHASLLARLRDARRALELVGGAARAVKDVARELERHVTEDDHKLVRFHQARESLRRMADRASARSGAASAPPGAAAGPVR